MARETLEELKKRRNEAINTINSKGMVKSQVDSAKSSLKILNRQIRFRKFGRVFTWLPRQLRRKPR
jgi:hypothetical protein